MHRHYHQVWIFKMHLPHLDISISDDRPQNPERTMKLTAAYKQSDMISVLATEEKGPTHFGQTVRSLARVHILVDLTSRRGDDHKLSIFGEQRSHCLE